MKKFLENIKILLVGIFTIALLVWFASSFLVPINNVTFKIDILRHINDYSFFIWFGLLFTQHLVYKKSRKSSLNVIKNFFNKKAKTKKLKIPKEPCTSCKKNKK